MTPPRAPRRPTAPPARPAAVSNDPLDASLASTRIAGLSGAIAGKLAAKGIATVRDLLEQRPRRYIDLSRTKKIRDVAIGEEVTILGTVRVIAGRRIRGNRSMVSMKVSDGTGVVEAIWWNQPYRERQFPAGTVVALAGRLEKRQGRLQMGGAFFAEPIRGEDDGAGGEGVHTGRIIPVHPATEGVSPTMMRRYVFTALKSHAQHVTDPLPGDVLDELDLMPRLEALKMIHFPTSIGEAMKARKRLASEELFVLSTGLALRKRRIERETAGIAHTAGEREVARFLESLPFTPTAAQRKVVAEIAGDMREPRPMHRLLQGEVGSGKTVVAVAAAIRAAAGGSQTAFMAPTEVLAEQHYLTIRSLLAPISDLAPSAEPGLGDQLSFSTHEGFVVELLTGSTAAKDRERALEAARAGKAHLLLGTHALIQGGVEFANLGLAIVDEQHRFGVHQRIALRSKGSAGSQPDVLIMTATPIPRTLAMTLYGDLDVSLLDEMPPGRMPVKTRVVSPAERDRADELIRREVAAGRQAFIVCPLVEKSSSLEAKAAEAEYERLNTWVFKDLRVGLIHGRMRPAQKEDVMNRMRAGEIDVLVATTVIEVGVDIPNATVMLIEDADRFGLAQLHQLRGRIGRGRWPSTCVLATTLSADDQERADAVRRLEAMSKTTDGFELAELDLEIRGEGQIFGRGKVDADKGDGAPAQAGATDLRFASLVRDGDLLQEARRSAFALVDRDPRLAEPDNQRLLADVKRRFADRLDWLFAG
jgi:ATP-dependent DNA helicase RecG